jgi:hypothetical protein
MNYRAFLVGSVGLVSLGTAAALAAPAPGGSPQTTEYWMTADTASGMGGMASGGMGSIMGAMLRGGRPNPNAYAHNLTLQLGSPRRAAGEPAAEHLVPPGLQAGPSLPLVTPRVEPAQGPVEPWRQGNMERPKGRMLIYWGCGDHAGPGQPFVIDFAKLSAGTVPPEMAGLNVRSEMPPSPSRFATYGHWPNEKSKTSVPANGSLVGDHVVRGNYSPEIKFTLGAGQDFLAPVVLTSNSPGPVGSVPLVWNPVGGARAWFLTSMGSGSNGDFVIWTSSSSRIGMSAFDYLPEGEIQSLVTRGVLLPGTADRCTVPAEVKNAMQQGMLTVNAFGGQTNISYPARPPRAPAGWRPEWTMKLRAKSTYMGMLGMSMEQMMGGRGSGEDGASTGGEGQGDQQQPKKKKKGLKGLGGLGGLIPH